MQPHVKAQDICRLSDCQVFCMQSPCGHADDIITVHQEKQSHVADSRALQHVLLAVSGLSYAQGLLHRILCLLSPRIWCLYTHWGRSTLVAGWRAAQCCNEDAPFLNWLSTTIWGQVMVGQNALSQYMTAQCDQGSRRPVGGTVATVPEHMSLLSDCITILRHLEAL